MQTNMINTESLRAGDVVEHTRNGERFTVDTVTASKVDWRFQGRQTDGSYISETGMYIVGHNAAGETVNYLAAQSCPWLSAAAAVN